MAGKSGEQQILDTIFEQFPTEHFTAIPPYNPSINASVIHKILRLWDFETVKLGNVWSGRGGICALISSNPLDDIFFESITFPGTDQKL